MSSTKALVSYSHDNAAHDASVQALAKALREAHIDVMLDEHAPPQGWPRWMAQSIDEAEFVLVVSTLTYKQRAEGKIPTPRPVLVRFSAESIQGLSIAYSGDSQLWFHHPHRPTCSEPRVDVDVQIPVKAERADYERAAEKLRTELGYYFGQPVNEDYVRQRSIRDLALFGL